MVIELTGRGREDVYANDVACWKRPATLRCGIWRNENAHAGAMSAELSRGGQKNEVRSKPPTKASLLLIWPWDDKQVERLNVVKSSRCGRRLVAGNRDHLKCRTNQLLQRRE